MIPPLISRFLTLRPMRKLIHRASGSRFTENAFRSFSGSSRVFGSMEEASAAVRFHRPDTCGHLDAELITSNFSLYSQRRMSDYPVLCWLLRISKSEKLSIFDFGGGVGQTLVNFSQVLPADSIVRWTVQDLPDVISSAPEHFPQGGIPPQLKFTADLSNASGCNVVLAAGSFHYWNDSLSSFFAALGTAPAHFIINRSPIRDNGDAFFTVQQGADWAVPCKVNNIDALVAGMNEFGYSLVDRWIDLEKTLVLPLFPDYSCPYQGLYFRRNEAANSTCPRLRPDSPPSQSDHRI